MNDYTPGLARSLLSNCLCHNVRMASRLLSRTYDDALRPTGLRATQIAVLAAVGAEEGALSIKALADALETERTGLTRNLRPLEQKGLITISPEGRHRSRTVALTKAGKLALLKAVPLWEKTQQTLMQQLGAGRWPLVRTTYAELRKVQHAGS